MASFRRELPSEGLIGVDVELWRGSLTLRAAQPGESGALESEWELDATTEGETLRVRQRLCIKRPLDLADLVGEQQVRVEIEGVVLFDKQIRHAGADVWIVLPPSVREVRCRTARGEIHLEGMDAAVDAYTGRGDVLLSRGRGRAAAGTALGDVTVAGWFGPLDIRTGKGNLDVRGVHGDLYARTGKGKISIAGATAKVDAHTGHGNLVASRLSGDASLSTGHGDLVATELEGTRLEGSTSHGRIILGGVLAGAKVKTGHGEIVCRLVAAEGDHELRTGRGDIRLDLQHGVSARIDASTRHGGVDCNLPLVQVGTSGPAGFFSKRLVGTSAGRDPAATIRLNTKDGDIRIFRRPESNPEGVPAPDRRPGETHAASRSDGVVLATTALPSLPEAAAWPSDITPGNGWLPAAEPQADQPGRLELEILGAVGRGELSVDEALVLLEGARRDDGQGGFGA